MVDKDSSLADLICLMLSDSERRPTPSFLLEMEPSIQFFKFLEGDSSVDIS